MAELDLQKLMTEAADERRNIAMALLAIQKSLDKMEPMVSRMEHVLASLEQAADPSPSVGKAERHEEADKSSRRATVAELELTKAAQQDIRMRLGYVTEETLEVALPATDGSSTMLHIRCSTEGPSHKGTTSASVFTPAATPTLLTASINIFPELTVSIASDKGWDATGVAAPTPTRPLPWPSFACSHVGTLLQPEKFRTLAKHPGDYWQGYGNQMIVLCTAAINEASADRKLDTIGEKLFRQFASGSKAILNPMAAMFGGIVGATCNTQMVIPHLTENYGASRDPPEEQAPICTVHSFPHNIDQCLTWARSEFEGLREKTPNEVNSFLSNPAQYAAAMRKAGVVQARELLERVSECLDKDRCSTFDDCISWARLNFEEYFSNRVKQLTCTFPEDTATSMGAPFWSGPKRCPHALQFSAANPSHLNFIMSTSIFRAESFGVAIPAAEIDGLRKGLKLPEPIDSNPADYATKLRRLPQDLLESVESLVADRTLHQLIGEVRKSWDPGGITILASNLQPLRIITSMDISKGAWAMEFSIGYDRGVISSFFWLEVKPLLKGEGMSRELLHQAQPEKSKAGPRGPSGKRSPTGRGVT